MDPPSCLRLRLRSLRDFFSNLQNIGIHRFECNVEHSPYCPVDGGIKSFSRSFGGDTSPHAHKKFGGSVLADTARQDAELESNETLHQLFKEIWLPHAEVRHLLYARMPVLFESDKMQNMQKGKSQKNLTHVQ